MVTNVTSLLKTVKTVEDETARGTRALEASIEAIGQDIKVSRQMYTSTGCDFFNKKKPLFCLLCFALPYKVKKLEVYKFYFELP